MEDKIYTRKSNVFSKEVTVSESWFEKNPEAIIKCGGCESSLRVVVSVLTVVVCPRCGATNEVAFKIR